MARLLRHLARTLKSGLALLFEPAEDPRETFASAGQRHCALLARVEDACARNTALRARLDRRTTQLGEKLPRLEALARQAVADGRDDLARMSLEHQQLILFELRSLEAGSNDARREEERMAMIAQRLRAQIEALRARQEMSAARYTAAQSQLKVSQAISGASKELSELSRAIEQAEHNAEQMQARAAAFDPMNGIGVFDAAGASGDPVGIQLAEFDIEQKVEERLAELKRHP